MRLGRKADAVVSGIMTVSLTSRLEIPDRVGFADDQKELAVFQNEENKTQS